MDRPADEQEESRTDGCNGDEVATAGGPPHLPLYTYLDLDVLRPGKASKIKVSAPSYRNKQALPD